MRIEEIIGVCYSMAKVQWHVYKNLCKATTLTWSNSIRIYLAWAAIHLSQSRGYPDGAIHHQTPQDFSKNPTFADWQGSLSPSHGK